VEQRRLDEQMNGYKGEIEGNLEKRVEEIRRLREEVKGVERRN